MAKPDSILRKGGGGKSELKGGGSGGEVNGGGEGVGAECKRGCTVPRVLPLDPPLV